MMMALGPLAGRASAQGLRDYAYADSLSAALLVQGRWAALDSVGRAAAALGTDYPALRRRRGAGALAQGCPAAALRHYGAALRQNPVDTAARYGAVQAYLALNQTGPARLLARALPDSARRRLHLEAFQAVAQVEAEGSVQFTSNRHRGTAGYGRLGLGSRLGPRLLLTQNLSYYGQQVKLPNPDRPGNDESTDLRQTQYHALLTSQLGPRWQAKLAYHYLSGHLGRLAAPGRLGYLALAYARPYWAAQAGAYAGTLADTARRQYDLRLTVYPLGNLRLYAYGRASAVHVAGGRTAPNGLLGAGGRLRPRLWAEAYGSWGQVPVLAELDGTYVYNLLDPLRRRAAASVLILLPPRLALRFAAGAEERRDLVSGQPYALYSLTSALSWTW